MVEYPKKMKFFSAIIVLSSLLPTEASVCTFCDGVTVDADLTFEVPDAGNMTCGMAMLGAALYEEGSEECTSMAPLVGGFCCPKSAVSDLTGGVCNFCVDADILTDAVIEDPAYPPLNCAAVALYFEIGVVNATEECADVKVVEEICCPGASANASDGDGDGAGDFASAVVVKTLPSSGYSQSLASASSVFAIASFVGIAAIAIVARVQ